MMIRGKEGGFTHGIMMSMIQELQSVNIVIYRKSTNYLRKCSIRIKKRKIAQSYFAYSTSSNIHLGGLVTIKYCLLNRG